MHEGAMAASAVKGTVFGVVMNDAVSLARFGPGASEPPYKGLPKAPVLYIKPANTLVGEGAVVRLPAGEQQVEVAATVGIVIGTTATRIDAGHAHEAIAGYVLAADLSLPHTSYFRPAIREKCFNGACPVSADPVSAAQVGSLSDVHLRTYFDELLVNERSLSDLLRDVPELLADVTSFMTLQPGDVMLVGVEYMAPRATPGTHIRIEGTGLGTLSFSIGAATTGEHA